MDTVKNNKFSILAISLIVIGAFTRLIPHMPNFTAMEGISLFAGAYLGSRMLKFAVPFIVLFGTDIILNNTISRSFFPNHEGLVLFDTYMIFNVIGMALFILIGAKFLQKVTAGRIAISALGASILFFIITNIGAWISLPVYTKDPAGLMTCFTAAIPFFWPSLLSSVVFSFILFGAYEVIKAYSLKSSSAIA